MILSPSLRPYYNHLDRLYIALLTILIRAQHKNYQKITSHIAMQCNVADNFFSKFFVCNPVLIDRSNLSMMMPSFSKLDNVCL